MLFSLNVLRFLFSLSQPRYALSETGVGGRGSDSDNSSPIASSGYSSVDQAIERTPSKPMSDFNLNKLKENSHWYDEQMAEVILKGFRVHPNMIALMLTLRRIYQKKPDECPIQVLLIISTLEFVVAYGKQKKNGTDIEAFIKFIREQWSLVGEYINLGQVPKGNRIHHLLAFCTFDCINNEVGTDGLDKMKMENHTLKYADHDMLHDYLKAAGYNECTKEDARKFASEFMTKSDTWIESGLVGEGNKWSVYEEQVNTRFKEFCAKFKEELQVPNGKSIIEKQPYDNFEGVHIVAAAGLLNVVLSALLTLGKHRQPLHLLVASTRAVKLLFDCTGHKFDVIESKMIVICPHIHPNDHHTYLHKYKDDDQLEKLDLSYSTALRPLNGVGFMVGGSRMTFNANLVDSSRQRADLQRIVREERKKVLNDPEAQEMKAQLDEHKRLEKRALKQQRILEKQEKKKSKK